MLSALLRAPFLRIDFLDIDEACHVVGSWQLMDGRLPYRDFVDNKPPLLYVYYALAQFLLGKGMPAVRLLTIAFTIPLTALAAARFYNYSRTGVVAGVLLLVYGAAFLAHDMHAVNAEILMLLPAAWAIARLREPESAGRASSVAVAGLMLGVAVLLKYQAAFWLPAVAAMIAIENRGDAAKRFTQEAILGTCFLLPLIATYGFFAAKGAGGELIYWNLTNNLGYAANPISGREAVGRAAAYFLPFLVATLPLWLLSFRTTNDSAYQKRLVGLLLVFTVPAALLGFRFFPHYFIQFYFPLSLAAAPAAAGLLRRPMTRKGTLFVACTAALVLGFTVLNMLAYYGPRRVYRETDPVFRKVGETLRHDRCSKGATMFVWGYAPMFYYYADIAPASRFLALSQSGLTGYTSGNLGKLDRGATLPGLQQSWDQLISDLRANDCTYVVDTAPAAIYRWNRYPVENYPRLSELIRREYSRVADVDGVVIYRRSGCANSASRPQ